MKKDLNSLIRGKLHLSCTLLVVAILFFIACRKKSISDQKITGSLRVSSDNPRYFANDKGKIVYLTGSHTWANLVDIGASDPPQPFDFSACLNWMKKYNHNFIRLWAWEVMNWKSKNYNPGKSYMIYPHPWKRTGPGIATDGKPKFNLIEFDEEYFTHLKSRVDSAYKRGVYVSVMLFEGWAMQFAIDGWKYHPFNPDNNINGIKVDLNGDGNGLELYTLSIPEITEIQKKICHTCN